MFYATSQNNSGGSLYENNDVRSTIIVEANNEKDAVWKLRQITEDYSDYCECCGERWSFDWGLDGNETPCNEYGTPIEQTNSSWYRKDCIIYYIDGTKKIYNFDTKEYTVL